MLRLRELSIYPVKSLRGIALERASVEERGLAFDRRWMVVDERGEMMTQRAWPRLAQIETRIEERLLLRHGARETAVALEPDGPRRRVRVWRDGVSAVDCGDEAARFLSEVLEQGARLVWMPHDARRRVDKDFAFEGEITSFSDGYPFLLLGQSTLDDLNDRLVEGDGEPVGACRFRPNFVFEGGPPLDEDEWQLFQIGEAHFEAVKPCSRCVIITIDQGSGEKLGPEPTRTEATYRKKGSAIYLGQNLLSRSLGEVRVGDAIEVLTRRAAL